MSEHEPYETIRTEQADGVGVITIDRPHALNALNTTVMHEVVAAALAFDADAAVGAIVLTGSDRAFAAGADIGELAQIDAERIARDTPFAQWDRLLALRVPLIAAVRGYALGGGCEIAMLCDLIVAGESAKFGLPELTLGVIPGIGGTQRLVRAVGKATAMDLILTGRMMTSAEALRSGLVARVVADDDVVATAREIGATIARRSGPAVTAAKEAVNRAFESSLAEGLAFEREQFAALFALPDRAEGMTAFLEKREPRFRDSAL